jgi:hypothetical protein
MKPDAEFEAWRNQWKSLSSVSPRSSDKLRKKAIQQQRKLRAQYLLVWPTVILLLGFSALVVHKNPTREAYLWAAVVWAATIVGTIFSLWNWHVLWDADLKSVSDFIEGYRKRCLAVLRAVRFGWWFLIIQLSISAPWLTLDYFRRSLNGWDFFLRMLALAALTTYFVFVFSRYRRNTLKELAELDATQFADSADCVE